VRWSDGKTLRTLAIGAIAGAAIVVAGTALATNLVGADATRVLSACVKRMRDAARHGRESVREERHARVVERARREGRSRAAGPQGPAGPQGRRGCRAA